MWSWWPTPTCFPSFSSSCASGRRIPDLDIHLNLDNITFVLNALDSLAGDNRFIDVRKRRPKYRTLTRIEEWTARTGRRPPTEVESTRSR